ncbi:cleavage and polyadenylation specificity factor subunit 2 [Perkinsus chesapeaki]|uniref:Cleavage and polyadenylation specificity factor subunit 2 n=1 Tax=Perkinsus chesapeaki TaxID=330153 RepID=A0A7J6MZQ9_PERCH|nr:cleavage and polyadenylation specificity factor subunit 2 [Perkinsus chesapeaki]
MSNQVIPTNPEGGVSVEVLPISRDTSQYEMSVLKLTDDTTGTSCTVLMDCGWTEEMDTAMLAPLVADQPGGGGRLVDQIDVCLLSFADLQHCGAWPYVYCHLRPKKLQYAVAPPPVGEADSGAAVSNQPANGAMVLATEPVRRLGELTLTALHEDIDKLRDPVTTSNDWMLTIDDTIMAFNGAVTPLQYGEGVMFSMRSEGPRASKGPTVKFTPLPAGRMLGGAYWRIEVGSQSMVYAVDYQLAGDRHLNGMELPPPEQAPPSVLITNTMPPAVDGAVTCAGQGATSNIATESRRTYDAGITASRSNRRYAQAEEALLSMILRSLRKDGTVLLPVDCCSTGRVLELLLLLEAAWAADAGLQCVSVMFPKCGTFPWNSDDEDAWSRCDVCKVYPIVYVSPLGDVVLDQIKIRMEWMSRVVHNDFDTSMGFMYHPFLFQHVQLCSSFQDYAQNYAARKPKVVLASSASLEIGDAREIFCRMCGDPNSMVIFTTSDVAYRDCLAQRVIHDFVAERPENPNEPVTYRETQFIKTSYTDEQLREVYRESLARESQEELAMRRRRKERDRREKMAAQKAAVARRQQQGMGENFAEGMARQMLQSTGLGINSTIFVVISVTVCSESSAMAAESAKNGDEQGSGSGTALISLESRNQASVYDVEGGQVNGFFRPGMFYSQTAAAPSAGGPGGNGAVGPPGGGAAAAARGPMGDEDEEMGGVANRGGAQIADEYGVHLDNSVIDSWRAHAELDFMRMKKYRKGWYHDGDGADKKEMKDEPHGHFRVKQQMKVAKDELKADIGEDDGQQRMKADPNAAPGAEEHDSFDWRRDLQVRFGEPKMVETRERLIRVSCKVKLMAPGNGIDGLATPEHRHELMTRLRPRHLVILPSVNSDDLELMIHRTDSMFATGKGGQAYVCQTGREQGEIEIQPVQFSLRPRKRQCYLDKALQRELKYIRVAAKDGSSSKADSNENRSCARVALCRVALTSAADSADAPSRTASGEPIGTVLKDAEEEPVVKVDGDWDADAAEEILCRPGLLLSSKPLRLARLRDRLQRKLSARGSNQPASTCIEFKTRPKGGLVSNGEFTMTPMSNRMLVVSSAGGKEVSVDTHHQGRPAAREAAQDLGVAAVGALGETDEEGSAHAQTTVIQVNGGVEMKRRRRVCTRSTCRRLFALVVVLAIWSLFTRAPTHQLTSDSVVEDVVESSKHKVLFKSLIEQFEDRNEARKCSLLSGLARVEKYRTSWANQSKVYCQGGRSTLECYDKVKGGVARNYLCVGRHLYARTEEITELTRHRLYGQCGASREFREIKFIECEDKKNKQLSEFKDTNETMANCTRTLETVIVFRTRETLGKNPWHSHEEIMTLFITMAAMQLNPGDAVLLVNRPRPPMEKTFPLLEIYETALAPGKLIYADELAREEGTICFDRVIFPVPPEQAFHTKLPLEGCGRSSILMAYREHIMSVYGVTPKHSEHVRVTVISRSHGFNRRVANEAELVEAFQEHHGQVRLVEFGEMKLGEQLDVAANTDVLVGVHGAALWWLILLPDCGQVLELGTGADGHYRDLAAYRGINHAFLNQRVGHSVKEFEVDIKNLLGGVDVALTGLCSILAVAVLWRYFRNLTFRLWNMAPRTKTNEGALLWVDCEMTNLGDAYGVLGETDRLLEVALIVTDKDLNIIHEGPDLVIHQPDEVLNGMNDWCRKQFGWKDGKAVPGLLADEVTKSTVTEGEADRQLAEVAAKFVGEGQGLLAGNTVHVDKRFLEKYMPRFSGYLHYRVLDVSTIKELAKRWDPKALEAFNGKRATHRALEDIQDSINELKHYRDCGFINCKASH